MKENKNVHKKVFFPYLSFGQALQFQKKKQSTNGKNINMAIYFQNKSCI